MKYWQFKLGGEVMAISETLKNAVEKKDITTIRSSFYTIIMSDPGFKTNRFDEALNYVKSHDVEGFIDVHDEEELLPESEWDSEYFDLLVSKMQDNFSEERIEQIKRVAEYISDKEHNSNVNDENENKIKIKNNCCPNSESVNDNLTENGNEERKWLGIICVVSVFLFICGILKRRK